MQHSQAHPPWIEKILQASQFTQGPLLPKLPPFPWESFEKALKEAFNLEQCRLKLQEVFTHEQAPLSLDEQSPQTYIQLQLSPLDTPLYLCLSSFEWNQIIQLVTASKESLSFADEKIAQAFQYFVFANVLSCLEPLAFIPNTSYSCQLLTAPPSLEAPYLHFKVQASFNDSTFYPLFIIPSSFKKDLHRFLLQNPLPTALSTHSQSALMTLKVQVGHVDLDYLSLKNLKLGDVVLLDQCSYQPEKQKGRALLTLNEQPLFRLLYGKESIKLLNYPLFQEELPPMDHQDEFSEDQLPEELSLDDSLDAGPPPEHPAPSDPLSEEELKQALQTPSPEESQALPPENNPLPEDEPPPSSEEQNPKQDSLSTQPADKEPLTPHAPLVSAQDIPIQLKVEVSTLQMSLKDLMELQPGSSFELDTLPEHGVSLVHQGKAIARGQLLQIGDLIGVKIVELKP